MLRLCSKRCKKAYEQKLEEERRAKLRHLAFLASCRNNLHRTGITGLAAPPLSSAMIAKFIGSKW
jgi:hypothetical protein